MTVVFPGLVVSVWAAVKQYSSISNEILWFEHPFIKNSIVWIIWTYVVNFLTKGGDMVVENLVNEVHGGVKGACAHYIDKKGGGGRRVS